MSDLTITTNNVPRPLVPKRTLPKKIRKDFNYVEKWDSSPRFVKYQGYWTDAIDTQRITTRTTRGFMGWDFHVEPDHPFAKWDAIVNETFFSGLLFRFNFEDDTVVVGRYCS